LRTVFKHDFKGAGGVEEFADAGLLKVVEFIDPGLLTLASRTKDVNTVANGAIFTPLDLRFEALVAIPTVESVTSEYVLSFIGVRSANLALFAFSFTRGGGVREEDVIG
jgi:hypothetical protein